MGLLERVRRWVFAGKAAARRFLIVQGTWEEALLKFRCVDGCACSFGKRVTFLRLQSADRLFLALMVVNRYFFRVKLMAGVGLSSAGNGFCVE